MIDEKHENKAVDISNLIERQIVLRLSTFRNLTKQLTLIMIEKYTSFLTTSDTRRKLSIVNSNRIIRE